MKKKKKTNFYINYLFKASITRCSQPLSGFSARCQEDEQLLQCILKTNPHANTMYIIDTRPRVSMR